MHNPPQKDRQEGRRLEPRRHRPRLARRRCKINRQICVVCSALLQARSKVVNGRGLHEHRSRAHEAIAALRRSTTTSVSMVDVTSVPRNVPVTGAAPRESPQRRRRHGAEPRRDRGPGRIRANRRREYRPPPRREDRTSRGRAPNPRNRSRIVRRRPPRGTRRRTARRDLGTRRTSLAMFVRESTRGHPRDGSGSAVRTSCG